MLQQLVCRILLGQCEPSPVALLPTRGLAVKAVRVADRPLPRVRRRDRDCSAEFPLYREREALEILDLIRKRSKRLVPIDEDHPVAVLNCPRALGMKLIPRDIDTQQIAKFLKRAFPPQLFELGFQKASYDPVVPAALDVNRRR